MATAAKTRPTSSRKEIYDWLNEKAKQLAINATLITHRAKLSEGRLYLPVYIGDVGDAYVGAEKLQELEASWNYQEPDPQPHIFLLPADESEKPGWTEAYAPVQQAIDRYHDAFNVFRAAGSSEEVQKALKDMEEAKTAELEAAKQLNHVA